MFRFTDRRATLHVVLAGIVYVSCLWSPSSAQLPARLEACAVSSPAETPKKAVDQPPRPKVVISEVRLHGVAQLSITAEDQLVASLEAREFDADSEWMEDVRLEVQGVWQNHGYFRVNATVEAELIGKDPMGRQKASLTIHVEEGLRYWLADIRFENATAFPPERLRELVPLADGEIFNVEKIREGLKALQKLYGSEGYVDFTAHPVVDVDDRQRISLLLELDEQKRFYVSGIEVLGLDPEKQALLKWKLRPGDPFNHAHYEDFWKENKDLLPADASPRHVEMLRDLRSGLVFLRLDFRGCPVVY